MPRPRYQINPADWFDCLDWFEHQLKQPHWLTEPEHPIHEFGLPTLQECIAQWRAVDTPSDELCQSVQTILAPSFTVDDWGRLRKSLSARKRRRKEKRSDSQPVNITLTQAAHQRLVEYKSLSNGSTLSEAVLTALDQSISAVKEQKEKAIQKQLFAIMAKLKASDIVKTVEHYLTLAQQKRSLANSSKIAFQLFKKRPDANSLRLVCERFSEDLVWNEIHLNIGFQTLKLFNDD